MQMETKMPAVLYKKKYDPKTQLWNTFWLDHNFKKNTGFDRTDFKYDRVFWMKRLHPDDAQQTLEKLEELENGKVYSIDITYRWLHSDGTYHHIKDCATLIKDSKKKPVEIIGSWVDVSPYHTNVDELEHLNKILMKRESEQPMRGGKVCNASFDPDSGLLLVGAAEIKIKKFSKQYYVLDIIFKDFDCTEKDWQLSEISEQMDMQGRFDWKKLYNVADAIRKNIAIETGIKNFFILTTQSVKINPHYLKKS